MKRLISIHDYEIGNQHNLDILDLIDIIKNEERENKLGITFNDIEYHHSLFYPILSYCIDLLNKSEDHEKIKLKVGLYKDDKIYVAVGRDMYDLFFTEKEGNINEQKIDFTSGKDKFDLNSIKRLDKRVIQNYKESFNIIIPESTNNDNRLDQLIKSKKKV